MLIEHRGLLSWVLERRDGSKKQKPCARLQDADRSGRSASCDPAMVFGLRMASILSGHTGAWPVEPSCRIAAGLVSRHEREHRTAVFAHHAPGANHHWLAPDAHAASTKNL